MTHIPRQQEATSPLSPTGEGSLAGTDPGTGKPSEPWEAGSRPGLDVWSLPAPRQPLPEILVLLSGGPPYPPSSHPAARLRAKTSHSALQAPSSPHSRCFFKANPQPGSPWGSENQNQPLLHFSGSRDWLGTCNQPHSSQSN